MAMTATARSVPGTLSQEIEVGGGHVLVTDQPALVGGDDVGPTPHALLPASLAGCVAVTLTAYARTKGWDLGQVTVAVAIDPGTAPRRCTVEIAFSAPLAPDRLARLEKVAASCPVRRSLDAGFAFVEHVSAGSAAA